jgi:HD-like signal output (HDOD) protein
MAIQVPPEHARAPGPVSGVFAAVYREILADRTMLPSMPDVALRLRDAVHDPRHSAASVARVIQADPATSAYLIRVANSALYGGVSTVQDVGRAVSRLGMDTTKNLVTAYALRAMFQTQSPVIAGLLAAAWRRSARTAALAALIAERCGNFESDRALLAGLMQDIGVLPLLRAIERLKEPPGSEAVVATVEAFAAKVGAVLLQHWQFDADIVETARSRGDWWRNPGERAELADVVLVARLHASVGQKEPGLAPVGRLPLINEIPAFAKLPLGKMGPQASLEFLREAESDVREMMQLLGA